MEFPLKAFNASSIFMGLWKATCMCRAVCRLNRPEKTRRLTLKFCTSQKGRLRIENCVLRVSYTLMHKRGLGSALLKTPANPTDF